MATKLSDLCLEEVSLVDMGANPNANLIIFKRDTGVSRSQGEQMTAEERIAKLEADVAKTNELLAAEAATRARLETVNKLSAEDRAAYEKLSASEQDSFHAADVAKRAAILQPLKPTESVEKQIADLKKQAEESQRKADEATAKAAAAESFAKSVQEKADVVMFEKRADAEIPNLPGTAAERGSILKSIAKLAKDEADAIMKQLSAANEAFAQLGKSIGSSRTGGGNASEKLESLAKARAASQKIEFAKAYELVVTENPQLYADYLKEAN